MRACACACVYVNGGSHVRSKLEAEVRVRIESSDEVVGLLEADRSFDEDDLDDSTVEAVLEG